MNHRRRVRTGSRRDGLVKPIRSDEVRYPDARLPESATRRSTNGDGQYREWRDGGRRLSPARDTGLALEGRMARERRRRAKARRRNVLVGVIAAATLLTAAIGWRYASDRTAAAAAPEDTQPTATATPAIRRTSAPDPSVAQIRALTPRPDPTPYFATFRNIKIHLPVSVSDLTEVAFHQASYSYAYHLKSPLPDAKRADAKKTKTTGRDKSAQASGAEVQLVGSVLRLWRSRPGPPDTAADVGAKAGSDVFAPVSGTVIKIKRYKLYNKYADYELHIKPEGTADIDCVMIHIDDLSVDVGDEVVGGVTRIASVRRLGDRVDHQLADYAGEDGDHVHLQFNNTKHPEYKGLEGAISVDGS